ncbi:MAG TPA: hypothetical protein VGI67_05475 [Thermoleophilaceae bacterium]
MAEYETDGDPMDALRAHLQAIRTASARRDHEVRGVAGLEARERLAHRLEPLTERTAALSSRVTARLEELGGKVRREPQAAADSDPCEALLDVACAAYGLGDDSTDRGDMAFWYSFGDSILDQYTNECL